MAKERGTTVAEPQDSLLPVDVGLELEASYAALVTEHNALKEQHSNLLVSYSDLQAKYYQLDQDHQSKETILLMLNAQHSELESTHKKLLAQQDLQAPSSGQWLVVEGSEDQRGMLEVFSIGRIDNKGIVLRYVDHEGKVLFAEPYAHASMISSNGKASLKTH